jgi:CRISPR-associated protein Csc2
MSLSKVKELLSDGLLDAPPPLIGAKTVQLILARNLLDFTVLRTEESREINYAVTPTSVEEAVPMRRVAFLGSKQKAAESRTLQALLRSANEEAKRQVPECFLKDNLCGECPRCALFGAVSAVAGRDQPNIKHRIEYGTAFSLRPYEEVCDALTFNAVDEKTQSPGRAFQSRQVVLPGTLFPSIVTLRSVSAHEAILALKAILATSSYGAETRIGGDVRNVLLGIVAGWEEVITSLELTLELGKDGLSIDQKVVKDLLVRYAKQAVSGKAVRVLEPADVDSITEAVGRVQLDKEFLDKSYGDVASLCQAQGGGSSGSSAPAQRARGGKRAKGTGAAKGDTGPQT